jgi:predicted acylesterase/phospholipase RssA
MKCLAIGPGAMGMFSLIGALHSIKDQLDTIEEISGASAGAIIGLCLSLNKEINEIFDFLFKIDIVKYYKFKIKNFSNNFGFIKLLDSKHLFLDFFGFDPTFKDLKKKLYVAIYNVNYGRNEYLSVDTHPDMSVIDAMFISMSIPFLFTSTQIEGNYYIDGGIYEKIPLTPFFGKKKDDVLGIELDFTTVNNKDIFTFTDFVRCIYSKSIRSCSIEHSHVLFNIIKLKQLDDVSIFDFKMSNDDKLKLFFSGYNQMLTNV